MVGSNKHAHGQPGRGSLQLHVSKLLLGCSIGAIAATAGLIVAGITSAARPRPPRGLPGELPPPPPPPSDALIISIGLFVLAWLAVLIALSRDQILHRMNAHAGADGSAGSPEQAMQAMLTSLREEVAADRKRELDALEGRVSSVMKEYGEQRETEGYVNGMRTALNQDATRQAEVRPIRGLPPSARTP